MIAVAWEYAPHANGYDRWITPYTDAGMETWVSPGVSNWRAVYPNNNAALQNIQRFVADGQRLGAKGELNTVWDDDGEGLFAQDWYGVLFGAAAGWQPGTSDIARFQQSYGQVFHNDPTGAVNQAQIELMKALDVLSSAGVHDNTDDLFWMDPWSKEGQRVSAKLLPAAHEMRVHAESAIVLIERARAEKDVRNADALDAMDLGARRLDFIGQKFQEAQEIVEEYGRMYAEQKDRSKRRDFWRLADTIYGVNGRCDDMRDGYGLLRDLYRTAWLRENRPYWLDNLMARYGMNMQLWIGRGIAFHRAGRQFEQTGALPPPQELGLPTQANASENAK
jgi:hypothetical protein